MAVALVLAASGAEAGTPVVAVFALEAKGTKLSPADLDGLADYIEASLAESGRFQVVPQTELRAALNRQKAESYKACYDESCQIEIGKELAAEKSLAGAVTRLGQRCLVTLKLFDLAKATQEAAGTGKGSCDTDGVLASLEVALGKLTGKEVEAQSASTVAPAPRLDRVVVPAGAFKAGCDRALDAACAEQDPGPQVARLAEFRVDRTEVTVAAYRACVTAGACAAAGLETPRWDGEDRAKWAWACNWGKAGREQHPINCVDWGQADAYCRWARGRLPTEAEWEKAARGEDGRRYPWGDQAFGAKAVANIADEAAKRSQPMWFVAEGYDDGAYGTAPVGRYPAGASPYGALDMIGNVVEWTASWHTPAKRRATRGGGWSTLPDGARIAFRSFTERHESTGFRCVDGAGGDVAPAPPPAAPEVAPKAGVLEQLRLKPKDEALDARSFAQVVRQHAPEIRACHPTVALGWKGKVQVEVRVGLTGAVERVRVVSTTLQNAGVERCITTAIRGWRFPKPKGEPMTVRYPFVFGE